MWFTPEFLYGVGTVILLAALIWGVYRYKTRNRANDPISEQATRELYKHPETYPERREELKKRTRPS